VRDYAKGLKAPGIRKILNEHYFEHALAGLPDAGIATPPATGDQAEQHGKTKKTRQDEFADLEDFEDMEADDLESSVPF
jgi:hypothetical protein